MPQAYHVGINTLKAEKPGRQFGDISKCPFLKEKRNSIDISLKFVPNAPYWQQWSIGSWWRHQMKTFFVLLAFVRGMHRDRWIPLQRPVTQTLMFSLICAWTNGSSNHRDAGDLRHLRAHYDVTVMSMILRSLPDPTSTKISDAIWRHKASMSDVYMCQQSRPSLVQIMACRLFGAKPLSEPMLAYC